MIHALFRRILLLQPPHPAERSRRSTLDRINPVEDCLQIEPRIPADDANIHTLPIAESFGHLRHGKGLALPAPVIEVHPPVVPVLNGEILRRFGRRTLCATVRPPDPMLQPLDALEPSARLDTGQYRGMVGQLRRQFVAFDIPVEFLFAQRLVVLRILSPTRTGDGMLNVVPPAVAKKLGNPDCLPRIKGTMPLLHPQTVFENILFGGLYGMSRRFDILLANLFGIFAVLSLPLPLVTFDGLPFVGVVQLAGELDIDFRATVNLSFAQEFIQQYAEPEQGSHGHRIPDSRDARRTQLQETLSVGRRRRIRLNHRRMVKALQPLLLYAPITPQIIANTFLLPCFLSVAQIIHLGGNPLLHFAAPGRVGIHLRRKHLSEVGKEYRLVVAVSAPQVGKYLVDNVQAQRRIPLRQTEGRQGFRIVG